MGLITHVNLPNHAVICGVFIFTSVFFIHSLLTPGFSEMSLLYLHLTGAEKGRYIAKVFVCKTIF